MSKNINFTLLSSVLSVCTLFASSPEVDSDALRYKSMSAVRTDLAPKIDGNLDDEVWVNAVALDDFIQYEPYNLKPPTVETEVRVLYDDNYVYIAFQNFDPDPSSIMDRISRRDDFEAIEKNVDWVGFGIDSNNDDMTGNWFMLTAAGVQLDVSINESGGWRDKYDISWNAVWDGKTQIHSEGWSAEIRVPFNVFQFTKNEVQTWGGTFQRGYFKDQEQIHWPGRSKGVKNTVPYYGAINGIKNIPQPKNLELVPYVLAGQTQSDELNNEGNVGLDLRYNLNSTATLNMTFNPDFGQVEADPSVLNLSAFETRLEEKRPFFVQGASFFNSWLRLFNSRRIGRRPNFNEPSSGDIVDQPNETTILSAAKVLGQTTSGIKYGIINAVTSEEYGTREYDLNGVTKKDRFLVEPYSNYFVGRFTKPIINDLSTVGFMATDLHRNGHNIKASSVKGDWLLNLMNNKLEFTGEYASTINEENGYAGRLRLSYRDPSFWEVATWAGFSDDEWNVNAMGFQQKNNNWYSGLRASFRRDQPKGIFLNQDMSIRLWLSGLHNGMITRNNLEIDFENKFTNYWNLGVQVEINPETYVDDDIYRDSRAFIIKDEAWRALNIWFSTDQRKKYIIRPFYKLNVGDGIANNSRGDQTEIGVRLMLKPTNNISFSINSSIERRQDLCSGLTLLMVVMADFQIVMEVTILYMQRPKEVKLIPS